MKTINQIIPGHAYFLFLNFVQFFSHIGIVMHIILVKMSRNSMLLIHNPSKRGDVKTLDPRFLGHPK